MPEGNHYLSRGDGTYLYIGTVSKGGSMYYDLHVVTLEQILKGKV